MKKITQITAIFVALIFLNSCNLFMDPKTEPISQVSIKPYVKLLGPQYMSLQKGETYVEHGAQGSVESENGSELGYTITDGAVDSNVPGFYAVEYKVANQFDWALYKYRGVLVYEGNAYGPDDIAGPYDYSFLKKGILISKRPEPGFWEMEDIWAGPGGVVFPVVFAETGNNTYAIVPGIHPQKGFYKGGTITITATTLKYELFIVGEDGEIQGKPGTWNRK